MPKLKPLILVTGGAGYVGSTFVRDALAAGYRVRILDLLIYSGKSLVGFLNHPSFELIKGDVRDKSDVEAALEGVEAVVHLAAIVGDRPCQAAVKSSYQINFVGTQLLAEAAKKCGISRFIFSSTCSNYGIMDTSVPADENRELNPISLYAETKVDCEHFLKSLTDDTFRPTSLRFGTAFGISFRTRFDLLVNSFVYEALKDGEIMVFAANTWRPYIHVADMSKMMLDILEADQDKVGGEIFNAGVASENFMKKEVVEMMVETIPGLKANYVTDINDPRDYRVDFTKLEGALNFIPTRTVRDGIRELVFSIENNILTETDFETNNLDHLEKMFAEQEKLLAN